MATLFDILKERSETEALLIENGGELTPEIQERLGLNEANLTNKIDGYHSLVTYLAYGSSEIDAEIKRLQGLKKSKANAQKRLKDYLLNVMEAAGIQRIDGVTCKAFIKANPVGVSVSDESALLRPAYELLGPLMATLPDYVKVDIKLDLTALKKHVLEADVIPAGVELTKTSHVEFR